MASASTTLTTIATIGVLGFVGVRLAGGVRIASRGPGRALVTTVVRGIRWRHVWPVPIVLGAVVATASAAMIVPGLEWGWWTALGGQGNPVTGTTEATSGTVWAWLVPLLFLTMLLPALPLFAHAEERMFRRGAQGWTAPRRAWSCVRFGLAHAVIGIPIGVALALSIGGAYFLAVYLRTWQRTGSVEEAMLDSTRAHTAYNATIVAVVLLAIAVEVLAR